MEKVIITVAPTGSIVRKTDNPHVPLTPEEIGETAYLCAQEGAAVIHVHCRGADGNATREYAVFRKTVDAIRKRTNLVVMVSTSGIAGTTDEARAAPLRTRPEMGSLTTGSVNFAGPKAAGRVHESVGDGPVPRAADARPRD